MKNVKFIIPMLAFVMAIGMSFAFTSEAPGDLVLEIDGVYYNSPIDCDGQGQKCIAKISKDGEELKVQVEREISPGNYVQVETSVLNTMVFPFSSLSEATP